MTAPDVDPTRRIGQSLQEYLLAFLDEHASRPTLEEMLRRAGERAGGSVPRAARASHRPLVARIWDLRANLAPHDAAYVALAELLDSVLVTADRGLGRASGIECVVEVLH